MPDLPRDLLSANRGSSKEKRDDSKIVVPATVVNREGLLVRT